MSSQERTKEADMNATDTKAEAQKGLAWMDATEQLRQDIFGTVYEKALAKLTAQRTKEGKPVTETQKRLARNEARGAVVAALYKIEEHNGVRNPVWDDEEWGPNRVTSTPAPAPAPQDDELEALVEWLSAQTWSSFAVSLATQYRTRGSLSPKQIDSAKSMKAKMDARQPKTPGEDGKDTGIDLSAIPSGYYAVPGGDTRLKVRIAHGKPGSKWEGWTFVSDGAAYGQRRNYGAQKPGSQYKGDIGEALQKILADPFEAQKAYGRLTGTCGACHRLLEDEDSISKGIGPICEMKWAA
jgi:hypothetical protein